MTNVDITQELPTVISFCSGYGGIERGLDLIGFEHRVIAYVEIEAYAIANLVNKMEAGLLPSAPIYTNLKTFPAHLFRDKVSLITGGYPCQPFSAAGQRKGTDDPRHLWPYIRRHIEAIRPVQCFFENVEGHISLGLSSVVSDLEQDGYSTTWGIFSAREVGAPHQRKRVYILANAIGKRCRGGSHESTGWEMEIKRPSSLHLHKWPDRPDKFQQNRQIKAGHQPIFSREIDGCADRVDRIRLLGNGVVPQTAGKAWATLNKRFN